MKQLSAWALIVALSGCASYPKMQVDAPLQVERGNWISDAHFYQRNHRIDSGDAKDKLAKNEEASSNVSRARAFDAGAFVMAVAGGVLLGWGVSREVGGTQVDKQTSLAMLLGGTGCVGLSVGFALGADANYVNAVKKYNEGLGGSAPAER